MPDLPTLTVTNAQATRMMACWGAVDPLKTPQENYQAWLKKKIIDEVLAFERQQELVTFRAEQDARDAQAYIDLGGDPPPTPVE